MTGAELERPIALKIHPDDTVAVALRSLEEGDAARVGAETIAIGEPIPAGHKFALFDQAAGDLVVKYGAPIGRLTMSVRRGAWVHVHNLETLLGRRSDHRYEPVERSRVEWMGEAPTFMGYRRRDGRVATRNEIWIVNTVGCVNHAAERIARVAGERFAGRVDGVHAFSHPYGCSQLGDDLGLTQSVLAGLLRHPNAGGVLVLGLGCENNQLEGLLARAEGVDRERVRAFNSQEVVDEIEEGIAAVAGLVARAEGDRREPCPASALVLGHKCGGSDGLSGLSANPLVGRIADRVTALGGQVLLTEVPEMFGAEHVLMARASSEAVFRKVVALIDDFKRYFERHGQPIYENPSPGNKEGGITTLEEKSLGAIQKGGEARVTDVLRYGEIVGTPGLSLIEAPGNDGVSSTAMVAAGATLLLFTTGRGTPLGFPVPTIKISSNSEIARRKPHWIDFDAGVLLEARQTIEELADSLFADVLAIASGRATNNERHGYREIAIWKAGVTL